jgi:hypothetical protein
VGDRETKATRTEARREVWRRHGLEPKDPEGTRVEHDVEVPRSMREIEDCVWPCSQALILVVEMVVGDVSSSTLREKKPT